MATWYLLDYRETEDKVTGRTVTTVTAKARRWWWPWSWRYAQMFKLASALNGASWRFADNGKEVFEWASDTKAFEHQLALAVHHDRMLEQHDDSNVVSIDQRRPYSAAYEHHRLKKTKPPEGGWL